jgi:radical SAM protein (TIGR01212 family)
MRTAAAGKRYRDFKTYLRQRFGDVVFKIPIDAGFTCPNRDGRKGREGCIYCDGRGSALRQSGPLPSVTEQVRTGMERYRKEHGASLFMPYFQTFTNTDASPERLRELYDEALAFPGTVGLSVGTRPDCLSDEVIDLLSSYTPGRDVWVELGLQSIHPRTLDYLNRCHTVLDFTDAVRRAAAAGLQVCAHVILGLPGETPDDMTATARALGALPVAGIKIHLLLVIEGTPLADLWRQGEVTVFPSPEAYAARVVDVLEVLPPEMVIQRLTADGYRDILLAPPFANRKLVVLNAIEAELTRRGTWQGRLHQPPRRTA